MLRTNNPCKSLFLIILALAFLGAWTLLPLSISYAQDDDPVAESTPEATPNILPGEEGVDHSTQSCGECHLDYHEAWSTGVHSTAYLDPVFQEGWTEVDNDPECLRCHTTMYQPATETYLAENVRCEACHGLTPSNHPPADYVVARDAGICGDCHTSTFDEWEHSLHAFSEDMGAIGCATCHNPHGQTVRFGTVNELCINCHKDNPNNPQPYAESYIHLTHNEIDYEGVEITCASCHMDSNNLDGVHLIANHTMDVTTVPCTTCHESISLTGASPIIVDVNTALAEQRDELQVRVGELESELAQLDEESTRAVGVDFVQLTQGLIIGIGIAITFFLVLRRRGANGHGA